MKLKKLNAALGLLTILFMVLHIGYSVFAYLTFYYNPTLKLVFAYPFMVLMCLHAVCGMLNVFTMKDGSRADLYPKQNAGTILQRVSAALIFLQTSGYRSAAVSASFRNSAVFRAFPAPPSSVLSSRNL